MFARIIASVLIVLALSAGVAYAAMQSTSANGTQVCVNSANGLMRVDSTCRATEYPLTIGGGSTSFRRVEVTQDVSDYVPASGPPGSVLSLSASCATGEKVVGGGALGYQHFEAVPPFDRWGYVDASWPSSETEWSAYFGGWYPAASDTVSIKVWAICTS
jgi:hypothetical protein